MARALLGALAVAACCAAPAAADTSVSGTLWLSSASRKVAAKADPGTPMVQPGVEEGVVWVAKVPERVQERLSGPPRRWFGLRRAEAPPLPSVAQRGTRFSPRVVVIPAGGEVEFANPDQLYHSAFSVSGARRFDLGKLRPGRRDTLAFPKSGVVNLHCEIHPKAVGYVVVTPNHAYARPDRSGRFRLPKLPPGSYVLRAWHPAKGELKLPFVVPRRGAVELNPAF